ncbi:MAG: family 78 glycoside hydrolase catalytic domain [Bacteroidaceae bacterium]|nr:family 78 glycoside hydrolase catalytic domain [Bacteroidaceae bacterium]
MNRWLLLILLVTPNLWAQVPDVELQRTRQTASRLVVLPDGNIFADFGRAAFGQIEITVRSASAGDTLRLHLGECCREGRVDRSPGGSRRYRLVTVPLKEGTHTYHPDIPKDGRNTSGTAIRMPRDVGEVMPFRYVEVGGCRSDLSADDLIRIAVNVKFDDEMAYFRCSDSILNAVWELCKYSVKATSFSGYYVDGDRERIPYEADALINQLCHYATDCSYDVARRTFAYLMDHPTWPTEWCLQMVLIAWYDYLYTGNTELILRYADDLRAHTLLALRDSVTGLITTRRGQPADMLRSIHRNEPLRDIVDWPHSGTLGLAEGQGGEDDGFVYTDFNAVVNAYHYAAVKHLAEMFAAIGKKNEAEELAAYAKNFTDVFVRAFLDTERGIFIDGMDENHASLHANMFAAVFGLVPEEYRESVAHFIVSRGMACSVYGAQFLLDALYDLGQPDAALALLTSQSDRSWVNMMREGSTVTMEAWGNRWKPNQDWNHAWGAAPANIIPFRLMGVRPLAPAFDVVEIRPQLGSLSRAECRVPSPKGPITVCLSDGCLSVDLPKGVKAKVYLPQQEGKSHKCVKGYVRGSKSWRICTGNIQ